MVSFKKIFKEQQFKILNCRLSTFCELLHARRWSYHHHHVHVGGNFNPFKDIEYDQFHSFQIILWIDRSAVRFPPYFRGVLSPLRWVAAMQSGVNNYLLAHQAVILVTVL